MTYDKNNKFHIPSLQLSYLNNQQYHPKSYQNKYKFIEMQDQLKQSSSIKQSHHSTHVPTKPPPKQPQIPPVQAPVHQSEPDDVKIQNYFTKIKRKNNTKASSARGIAEMLVNQGIQNGQIEMSVEEDGERQSINPYLVKKMKTEDDNDQKRKIQMNLEYLRQQLGQIDETEGNIDMKEINILSKKQHKEFIQKMEKSRVKVSESRKKKFQIQKQKQKMEEEQKRKEIEEQQEKQKLEKKKKILQKIQQQKEKHEQILKNDEEGNKKLAQVKNSKALYEKIEQNFYRQVILPSLEEKKRKLKEKRQMVKAFDTSQLKEHEIQYLRLRQKSFQKSNFKEQWHYKRPPKSERLLKIMENEKFQLEQKELEKKRKFQENIRRKMEFEQYLKERAPPKIDPKKRIEIQNRTKSKTKPKKADKNQLGILYLQEMKKASKKTSNRDFYLRHKNTISETKTQKVRPNYLEGTGVTNKKNLKVLIVDKIIESENYEKMQKIRKLKIESDKLNEEAERKEKIEKLTKQQNSEKVDLMLASIRAKMGIIEALKE